MNGKAVLKIGLGVALVAIGLAVYFPEWKEYLPNRDRDLAVAAYNDYATYKTKENEFIRKAFDEPETCLATFQEIRSTLEKLNPYSHVGVDPQLAQAIADYRESRLKCVELWLRGEPVSSDAFPPVVEKTRASENRIKAEMNRIAHDLGGVRLVVTEPSPTNRP